MLNRHVRIRMHGGVGGRSREVSSYPEFAKKQLERINAGLNITSEIDNGTEVEIVLPISKAPAWFCDSLNLFKITHIVILDDDSSVHDAWKIRLKDSQNLNIVNFFDQNEFLKNYRHHDKTLYLIDFEIQKGCQNGLEIIEGLKIHNCSYMVTNNYDDEDLREKCTQLGLKIIPKPYIPHLSIINQNTEEKTESSNSDKAKNQENLIISVIDNEKSVLDKWKSFLGHENTFYFEHPDDFILSFSDNFSVKKTNLVITDYYFDNVSVTKLIDFIMLKDVLEYKGKIFLFSNLAKINGTNESILFDHIFESKNNYLNRESLEEYYFNKKQTEFVSTDGCLDFIMS